MFETRSQAWADAGLEFEINRHAVRTASRRLVVEIPVLFAVVIAEAQALNHIKDLAKTSKTHPDGLTWIVGKTPVKIAAVILVLALGWLISRDLSKVAPALFKRMDPATAGTVEFAIRFISVAATVLGGFAVAGISLQAVAVGGAFTAVVLGLAAQQTLGNVFAGMVLLTARPFRLGERVRLQAGVLAGSIEGIVASLGLLYTTLSRGDERVMIPNTVVLSATIVPVREPESVDVKVTLGPGVRPSHVQAVLDANISTPTRKTPRVLLEEISGASVVVRVQATPERSSDGARLADEIIAVLVSVTGEHSLVPDVGAPRS
ncbi:MAG TPA: mechanosensitive ion channel family protein [Solirubrobacteraceae bacterium]|nr:mechanosensitive ion channel family protein [Solirubrobacteraceae bacterium]